MAIPAGSSLSQILTTYADQVRVGLFTNNPAVCPPDTFANLSQPTFNGYTTLQAFRLGELTPTAGSDVTARRVEATFRVSPGEPPVTINGWFAFVLLDDASRQVLLVRPFGTPVTLSAHQPAMIATEVAVGAGQGPGGRDLLAIGGPGQRTSGFLSAAVAAGTVQVVRSDAMAKVFRGEQRAALKSGIKTLRKLLAWDTNLPNRPVRSKLFNGPLLTGVVSDLLHTAGPPPTFYHGDELANQVLTHLLGLEELTVVPTPP